MTATNFDEIIERRGTGCNKWDRQDPKRGKPKEPALAFTIADMDYAVPPCILESMKKQRRTSDLWLFFSRTKPLCCGNGVDGT